MGERLVPARHRPRERRVESEPQAVAGDGLVRRRVARAQREAGRVVEHLAVLEVLEPGTPHPHGGAHASPAARPRSTVASASLRLASSIISPSSSTAPAWPFSSAATTLAARSSSSGAGVKAALMASSWSGWTAHLPSKPSVRACAAQRRRPSASRIAR